MFNVYVRAALQFLGLFKGFIEKRVRTDTQVYRCNNLYRMQVRVKEFVVKSSSHTAVGRQRFLILSNNTNINDIVTSVLDLPPVICIIAMHIRT